jgi:photosystem II stability/assembly factor-like uncharacterized protein
MKKLLFYFAFLNYFISSAQWLPQNSGTSNFLNQIYFLNSDTGYVVQDNGILRRTINGGTNWNILYSGVHDIYQVNYTSYQNGNALGYYELLKTTDGGLNWTTQHTDSNCMFHSIFFSSPSIGYVSAFNLSTNSSNLFKTTNGGISWSMIYSIPSPSPEYFYALSFPTDDTGYVAFGTAPIVRKTLDGGFTWLYDTLPSLWASFRGIHFISSEIGYVCSDDGSIFKTINHGNSWTDITDPGNSLPLYSIFFTSSDTGYTVGGDGWSSGVILKTTDGGNSWTNTPFLTHTYNSVFFPTFNIGYTCGTGGSILKYTEPVGLTENDFSEESFFYPNPSTGRMHFKSGNSNNIISIYNSFGVNLDINSIVENNSTINLSHQPKGIYFVKIKQGDKVSTQKIVLM